jgi:4-hydroxy-3-methylbut-2-enyl diphosphate reductase
MDAMNRSTVREFQAPGTSVGPGEVLVPTEIGDPGHGPLRCPAGPLVGGTLRRKGTRVGYAPVGPCADPAADDGGAVIFVATCPQRDGTQAAVAAAACPADRVAVAAARSAVDEWATVFGTRRLLAAGSPWCEGATRALAAAHRALEAPGEAHGPGEAHCPGEAHGPGDAHGPRDVHILGWLAADPHALSALAQRGARFAGSLDEIPDGATVLFPAHGVSAAVQAKAAARGLKIIDATCPLVAGVHAEARRFAERGDDLVLVGQAGHAVVDGITGQAPGGTTVVPTPASTAALRVTDPRRVSYLLQPGIPVEDAAPVTAALRSRFPALHGPNPDGFCYAASDRAETIQVIASASDVMLVLGSADSPDTRQLCALARGCRARTHVVGDVGDILASMLGGAATVGLAESTSAGPDLAARVTGALSGLGRLSITRRHVRTDVLGAPSARP